MKDQIVLTLCLSIAAGLAAADFQFAVVGDRTGSHVDRIFEEIIEEIGLFKPDFVINVGDLIEGYDPDTLMIKAQWDSIQATVRTLGCRFYFVPGNHDIQNAADESIFESISGTNDYYSFDYQNSHFIVVDNVMVHWTPPQEIGTEQLAWLRKDLEEHRRADNIFVFFHVPTWSSSWNSAAADTVEALCERHGVKAVFTGHHHTYTYFEQNGTRYVTLSSSGGGLDDLDIGKGNLFSYLLVTVRGNDADVAVMKKGAVMKPDFFTREDDLLVMKIFKDAVKVAPCQIRDENKKTTQSLKVTVTNFGPDTLNQIVSWTYDPKKYAIKPVNAPLVVASNGQKDLTCDLTVQNGSDIYPLPQFMMIYPYKPDKQCTVRINTGAIRRIAVVNRINKRIIIDGILDDAAWKKITPLTDLTSSPSGASGSAIDPTEYYLAHDADNLYMAVRCHDQDLSRLMAQATEQDGATYYDDNIWFFLDSDFDRETYHQAIINSNGAVFDRACSLKDGESTKDVSWNGPWEARAGKETAAWTLEVKIPKAGLGPFDKKHWGFAFRRLQTRTGDAVWQMPFGHDPASFGILEFE